MKKIIALVLFFILLSIKVEAATYYVRTDGGTATQCLGVSDKPYTPIISDVSRDCAFNHPFWAISVAGNPTKMVGGDTLIIGPGEYMMGWGAPNIINFSTCHSTYPWGCYMSPIPSGPDALHPTRILGRGWDTANGVIGAPKLWGTERTFRILNLQGSSNVEIQYLDVTDKSNCIENGPDSATRCQRSTYPYGQWAVNGIEARDSNNVLIKNVDIHGLVKGIFAGRVSNWTLENVNLVANSFAGWDGDIGATTSSNSGNIIFKNSKIQWSGCGQNLDGTPHHCYSQDQGGYGDGLGTATSGGNWVFDNTEVVQNVSDGIDLLYHNGNGTITITGGRYEANAGNQIKVATTTTITGAKINGNCEYFKGQPFTATTNTSFQPTAFNDCRAGGTSLAISARPGKTHSISQSTVIGRGDVLIMTAGSSCNGTEKLISNKNIFVGYGDYWGGDKVALYYAAGAGGNGDGTCGLMKLTELDSVAWNVKEGCPVGNKCADPLFMGPLSGDNWGLALQSSSPAIGYGYSTSSIPVPSPTPSTIPSPTPTASSTPTSTVTPVSYMTITAFETWLTTTTIQQAPVTKIIRIGSSPNYKYFRIDINKQ